MRAAGIEIVDDEQCGRSELSRRRDQHPAPRSERNVTASIGLVRRRFAQARLHVVFIKADLLGQAVIRSVKPACTKICAFSQEIVLLNLIELPAP